MSKRRTGDCVGHYIQHRKVAFVFVQFVRALCVCGTVPLYLLDFKEKGTRKGDVRKILCVRVCVVGPA